MHTKSLLRLALAAVTALVALLAGARAARAQEPAPVPIKAEYLAEGGPIQLVLSWRYRAGDDPGWAGTAVDDSDWEIVEPLLATGGRLPRDGWSGTGWFRRHLRIDPALEGKPLVIRVETPGSTAVFLDGKLLMEASVSGSALRARRASASREIIIPDGAEHVFAVHHTTPPGYAGKNPGFFLSLEPSNASDLQLAAERRNAMRGMALGAVPAFLAAFLALFHLALYLSYPKARENLFYALAVASSAATIASELAFKSAEGTASHLGPRLYISGVLCAIFFGLLTYYSVRTPVFPKVWKAFAALGVALIAVVFFHPDPPNKWIWSGYFGLLALESIRVELAGGTVKREGSRLLLGGFLVLNLVLVYQILLDFRLVDPIAGQGNVWVFGMFGFEVAMSLFLARSFARTSLHLERRLDEVRSLSEQVLNQRLLEAEHARKASEIEAARELQLSMLPRTLPSVAGLETAAAMITASEVGGDYYDFRIAPDGSLLVAFGDATGHGVAAGIMVTAVKALFSTLGGGESLSGMLAEHDRVLRGMQIRSLHMCLALARLTPGSITICSAAMPPVLIHRAATGALEELGDGGRPIGSRLTGAWTEHRTPLHPGDTLLFASDGFAEQLDAAGNQLGYEKVGELFRAAAGSPPAGIVESLLARASAWRGEREQGDDLTLVVIRAAG